MGFLAGPVTFECYRASGAETKSFGKEHLKALAKFAIAEFGSFDIWVNNAGIGGPYGATLDLSAEEFLAVLSTNALGAYHGSVAAMRHFLPKGAGKLVNVLGAGERKPVPFQNAYGSSKAWIRNFTLALGREYRGRGVGVFAFQPGLMETELLTDIVTYPGFEGKLSIMPTLIRAIGKQPERAAKEVLRLVSSATDGKDTGYSSLGSSLGAFAGFAREGLRAAFRLPARAVEVRTRVKESAFKPLP
jgi:glucose 1-dehydrogenase